MTSVPSSAEGTVGRLPAGTVTFVFTDIEGSTRLEAAIGAARYGELLELHRSLLRSAFTEAGGLEVGTEGDSFFVVFTSAPAAIVAAVDGQRALAAADWPADAPIRVRMGVHTGEGRSIGGGTYVGHDVNRAARIAAAGHGGQVLVSESTRPLVADALPGGVSLQNLGEHRLKDLRPERLFQLVIGGLPSEFPALRSLDRRPNNLPTQLTSFVGRDRELEETLDLLDGTRLLTLTGPGGTGKTRLALQLAAAAAERFPEGVWFVALEPIRDPGLVAPTIARTLGIPDRSGRSATELLVEDIGERAVLIVLDNFEQVIDAAPVVAELLRACPSLATVVTSRANLHVSGEQEYPVPGLPAPPDPGHLSALDAARRGAIAGDVDPERVSHYEAVRLFIARAVAVRPGFEVTNENAPAVAAICARLQGMPLAIELAAARVKLLAPDAILARLERRLELLVSGARDVPDRQRTLRGAIAWSYDLLDEGGRRLLDRLSVFVGGCDLSMAEQVVGPPDEASLDVLDGLGLLVDQSLLRSADVVGGSRFVMLDTIRAFALERLEASGDGETIRRRHASAFLELAERAAPELTGAEQRVWLDRLERDHDNIRAALDWSVAAPDPETAVRLGFAMWRFWQQRGYLTEARGRLDAMESRGWDLTPQLRGHLLEALGGVGYWQADHASASGHYSEAVEIWRRIGDRRELANALYNLGYVDIMPMMDGSAAGSGHMLERMNEAADLFRSVGDRVGEANALWGIGSYHYFRDQPADAEPWFRSSLELFRSEGNRMMEAWALHMLGSALLKTDRVGEAGETLSHALRHFHEAGDLSGVTLVLDDLSAAAVAGGDLPRAARLRGAARRLQRTSGTEFASWVEDLYEQRTRPNARQAMTPEDLRRFGAEGAAMPLDDVVAYALGRDVEPA